jgi:UDP-N-acetylmuramate dehydrogenase
MQIQTDVPLKDYSTMRLGGIAHALTTVITKQDVVDAIAWATERKLPVLVLGGGSNVIFSDGYPGLVIINRITGFEIVSEDTDGVTIDIGAGENWDDVVARTVAKGLHGIESLSAIPGTAGGTPVQNVGAYGTEIADTLVGVEVYDMLEKAFVTFSKTDCHFAYRTSIFKWPDHNRRYVIVGITLRLEKSLPRPPFYASLQQYLDEHSIANYTPQTIRDAVIAIRAKKLPDPRLMANTGSFFKNPLVDAPKAEELRAAYPTMPHWPLKDGRVKLAAGWLIEQAGLRGYAAHGLHTYERHALVIVNDHAKSYDDLRTFTKEIIARVDKKFGVTLEQEPELL